MSSPSSAGSTAAEATPDRPKWGTRLTTDMREKLAAARTALGTDSVAKLMTATGASRSNVRTWRRSTDAPVKLGRPTFFSPEEEDVIATYMAAWTKGGDLLTCELAAVLFRQYIADVRRDEESERRFGDGGFPGRSFFDLFLKKHPQLRRVRPVGIESARADASTPEAVAKFFAAFRFLCRDFNITRSAQVWNTDESMMNAQALMETTPMTVVAGKGTTNPDFVFPSVQSGAEAASLVATVCADGTRLPLFVIVAGSGGRLPYAVQDDGNGKTRRVPLAAYLDEGAEVHRREKPGFDGDLWDVYASFAARGLAGKCPGQWKVLLMDGCKVHASVIGLRMLKASKVVVLMFPTHLSHILQALDSDPFLKTKVYARAHIRGLLPTLPRNSRFNLVHLMGMIKAGAFQGLSSVNIVNGFKKTGTWPICPSEIDVGRLVLGKGSKNSVRKVDLELLATRLGPEARRDMRQPIVTFASVSTRGLTLEATAPGVLKAFAAQDAESARKRAAKDKLQAARDAKAAAAIAAEARQVAEAAVRRGSPEFQARKRSLRERAERARAAAGDVGPYTPEPGAVVELEARRKRQR